MSKDDETVGKFQGRKLSLTLRFLLEGENHSQRTGGIHEGGGRQVSVLREAQRMGSDHLWAPAQKIKKKRALGVLSKSKEMVVTWD